MSRVQLGRKFEAITTKPDRQSSALGDMEVADEEFVEAFQNHFAGTEVLSDQRKVRAATVLYNTMRKLQGRNFDLIIDMGRALIRAEQVFSPAEWKKMIEGGRRILGVVPGTASMCRQIARGIDNGILPRDLCPEALTTAYVFTTYESERLQLAIEQKVLRPDVTRREAVEFKNRDLREIATAKPSQLISLVKREPAQDADTTALLHNLHRRERRLTTLLAQCREKIEAIKNQRKTGE
jgi:hypothetical protein